MKFGKYITDKQSALPSQLKDDCVEYVVLKHFIKHNLKPFCLSSFNTDGNEKIVNQLEIKLSHLSKNLVEFLKLVDIQVENLNKAYYKQSLELETRFVTAKQNALNDSSKHDMNTLLKDVVVLERFILLNYTGITKLLKKQDRHTGMKVGSQYLHQLTSYPFFKSERLSGIKKELMDLVTGSAQHSGTNTPLYHADSFGSLSIPPYLSLGLEKDSRSFPPPASLLPNQKVLISMSGPHGTDIIGAVLDCVQQYKLPIEDFVLSRLYHNVTFGCLTSLKSSDTDIFALLTEKAKQWDATLYFDSHDQADPMFRSLEDAPYTDRGKFTATVLHQSGLTSGFLFEWMKLLLGYKISVEKMIRLGGSQGGLSSVDFRLSVPKTIDMEVFRKDLFALSGKHFTDVALQPDDVFRKSKRLVIFDMDSTLIQQEVIDEIAKHSGVVDDVAKITEAAMNGEIDFKESLRQRVGLLKGTSVGVLDIVKQNLTFTEGAHDLCKALKKLGYKLAVISGGFLPLALHVKSQLGLDYAFANQLKVSPDGKTLMGETFGPIVDGIRKAELLDVIAQAEGITPDQVIAVGDGANDLWMLAAAGLGIAFNAKPRVQEKARARINQRSLRNILYLLGYTDEELKQLEI